MKKQTIEDYKNQLDAISERADRMIDEVKELLDTLPESESLLLKSHLEEFGDYVSEIANRDEQQNKYK